MRDFTARKYEPNCVTLYIYIYIHSRPQNGVNQAEIDLRKQPILRTYFIKYTAKFLSEKHNLMNTNIAFDHFMLFIPST
jgi:hypothetical protein